MKRGEDGAPGKSGAKVGQYQFGASSPGTNVAARYLIPGGSNPNIVTTSEFAFLCHAPMKLKLLTVSQKVGIGSAVHRYEIYRSVNGGAFAGVSNTLDLGIAVFAAELQFETPITCAKWDRVGLTVLLASGSVSSGSVNIAGTIHWELI